MTAVLDAPAVTCTAASAKFLANVAVDCDGPDTHEAGASVWHAHADHRGWRYLWTNDGRAITVADGTEWHAPTAEEESERVAYLLDREAREAAADAARRAMTREDRLAEEEFRYRIRQTNRRSAHAVLCGLDVVIDDQVVATLERGDIR